MAKCLVPWCIARCACASRCACAMCHCCCAKIGYSRRGYSQAHLIRPICTHDNLTAQERRTCQHFLPIFSTQQACLPVQVPLRQLRPSPAFNGEIFFCMRIENCAASILLNALRTPPPKLAPYRKLYFRLSPGKSPPSGKIKMATCFTSSRCMSTLRAGGARSHEES